MRTSNLQKAWRRVLNPEAAGTIIFRYHLPRCDCFIGDTAVPAPRIPSHEDSQGRGDSTIFLVYG